MFLPSGSFIIVGLENFGHCFYADCREFCRRVGQSDQPTTVFQIYQECVSQIICNYSEDPSIFMVNLLSIPNFKLIAYTENPIELDVIRWFKGQVRIFAINLYNQMARSIPKQPIESFYTMEMATVTMVGLKRYNVNTDIKG